MRGTLSRIVAGLAITCLAPAAAWAQSGTVVLSYTIRDPGGLTASANITVSVVASNNVPVAVNDFTNTLEDAAVSIAVLANDSDLDGDALTITGATPTNGTVSIVGTNLVFTPATRSSLLPKRTQRVTSSAWPSEYHARTTSR